MSYEAVLFEISGRIANVTLNRPEKYNALNEVMLDELLDIFEKVGSNDDINVLTITGAGKAFCSGVDVNSPFFMQPEKEGDKAGQEITGPRFTRLLFDQHKMIQGIYKLPQVTIASINGVCVGGGGFGMAMACDMRVASEKAKFWMVPARMGVIQDFAIPWFLARLIGTAKTCELLFTGDRIDGIEAARLGIVNRAVPLEDLPKVTAELVDKVAAFAPFALRLAKHSVYRGLYLPLQEQLDTEAVANGLCAMTKDAKEAFNAFFEKRKPVFQGE
ncbi:MAG: enoyl-CoA hydratase-related protein [Pseudomonadota bacterium]